MFSHYFLSRGVPNGCRAKVHFYLVLGASLFQMNIVILRSLVVVEILRADFVIYTRGNVRVAQQPLLQK